MHPYNRPIEKASCASNVIIYTYPVHPGPMPTDSSHTFPHSLPPRATQPPPPPPPPQMEETGELFPKAGIKLPAGYKLPRGYYFNPSDYDVICYLQCKAMEEQSPCEGAMADVDLYGDKEPWEIFEDFELKKSGHFFSRFKDNVRKIGVNGGVWKAVDEAEKVIYHEEFNDKEVGRSRAFVYSNDNVQQQNDYRWLMTEYVLSGDTLTDPKLKHSDYAVCFIRKKNANGDDDDATDNSEDDYISNYDDDDDDDDVMDDSDLEEDAPLTVV